MSKSLFDPRTVPLYPQTSINDEVDVDSLEIVDPANPYIMRARLRHDTQYGPWSVIQLPDYYSDEMYSTGVTPWEDSTIANQTASLDIGTTSTIFVDGNEFTYVSAVNINLTENRRHSITGVKVWIRWVEEELFGSFPVSAPPNEPPLYSIQVDGDVVAPPKWNLIGVYQASSFTTAIPRNNSLDLKQYFQILITDNTTIKPNKFNYRWVGQTEIAQPGTDPVTNFKKVGEPYTDTIEVKGYIPWNPYYGASIGDTWNTYGRQRSTLQDIAIFYPRPWRIS